MSSPEKFYIYDTATKEMVQVEGDAPTKIASGKILVQCNEPVRGVLARHEAEIAILREHLTAAVERLAKAGL